MDWLLVVQHYMDLLFMMAGLIFINLETTHLMLCHLVGIDGLSHNQFLVETRIHIISGDKLVGKFEL